MTFYRPGGTAKAPNRQYDSVYTDAVGGATDWLPVNKGDNIAVNIVRASIVFNNAAQSVVTKSPVSPEVQVLAELKMFGGDPDGDAWPIDQWQNLVVATSRRSHRAGWVRLRVVNINNADGTGVAMALQVTRSGSDGVVS
jgi:hypothetical protein